MPSMVNSWAARRSFWNRLAVLKFAGSKVVDIPLPGGDEAPVRAVRLSNRFPGIGIHDVLVAERIPVDEDDARAERFYRVMARLFRTFGPHVSGAPAGRSEIATRPSRRPTPTRIGGSFPPLSFPTSTATPIWACWRPPVRTPTT